MSDYTPKAMASGPPDFSGTLLDVIETFLDGAPALEEADVQEVWFSPTPPDGVDFHTIFDGVVRYVTIDGVHYKVAVMREED